ncbi:MAG: hypothetical protein JXN61_09515 [Sedimentisphaerales bacterium]|nr:hypothetical protein [Sedimentisphaerales bacterium]
METNEPQVEQSGSGGDASSGDGIGSAPRGKRNWRTILFVALVVLACVVTAHSVLTNGNGGCPIRGLCSLDNGGGQACAIDKGNGNGDSAVCPKNADCPIGQACSQDAPCPLMGTCPSQEQTCPMSSGQGEAAGCCPSTAPDEPAPQPAPAGCCPGSTPADPAPQPAPAGCCPASGY